MQMHSRHYMSTVYSDFKRTAIQPEDIHPQLHRHLATVIIFLIHEHRRASRQPLSGDCIEESVAGMQSEKCLEMCIRIAF